MHAIGIVRLNRYKYMLTIDNITGSSEINKCNKIADANHLLFNLNLSMLEWIVIVAYFYLNVLVFFVLSNVCKQYIL